MEKEKPISYEQTPEQIREVLDRALQEKRHVDLVILSLAGEPTDTPDLIVEEINGDILYMSYVEEDGELEPVIPLEFSRIKKAEIC